MVAASESLNLMFAWSSCADMLLLDLPLATVSGESMLSGFLQCPFDYFAHCIQNMVCLFFPVPVNHTVGVLLHGVTN
jgi:hypothetical protein